jgi:hypothetical protein
MSMPLMGGGRSYVSAKLARRRRFLLTELSAYGPMGTPRLANEQSDRVSAGDKAVLSPERRRTPHALMHAGSAILAAPHRLDQQSSMGLAQGRQEVTREASTPA